MPPDKICKTVFQYSKGPIAAEDMKKLQEIAADYSKVKNYVYKRYGGIKSLTKIYPGYTVQNEMTESGLRTALGLPSVYFYLAVFDALGDIKTQWTKVKNAVLSAVNRNERFTADDRHYLRFVVKVSGCFANILNGKTADIPETMRAQYESVAACVDEENLNRYLCRQVRKRLRSIHTDKTNGFFISERAYRYGKRGMQQGIFISTKEKRRRIFIPLTDENQYSKQLCLKLKPEKNSIELAIPMETDVRRHRDYVNEIGLSAGMQRMFTTDQGTIYGEKFGEFHRELVDFMNAGARTYRREGGHNPGRKKYEKCRRKLNARMETYVNQEVNRMLTTEKPKTLYIPKLPQSSKAGVNSRINYSVGVWKKGYIRKRLEQKCRENAVEIVYVIGRDISRECSECGAVGPYGTDIFQCECCGHTEDKKINAAKNAVKRGKSGQRLNAVYVDNRIGRGAGPTESNIVQ